MNLYKLITQTFDWSEIDYVKKRTNNFAVDLVLKVLQNSIGHILAVSIILGVLALLIVTICTITTFDRFYTTDNAGMVLSLSAGSLIGLLVIGDSVIRKIRLSYITAKTKYANQYSNTKNKYNEQ